MHKLLPVICIIWLFSTVTMAQDNTESWYLGETENDGLWIFNLDGEMRQLLTPDDIESLAERRILLNEQEFVRIDDARIVGLDRVEPTLLLYTPDGVSEITYASDDTPYTVVYIHAAQSPYLLLSRSYRIGEDGSSDEDSRLFLINLETESAEVIGDYTSISMFACCQFLNEGNILRYWRETDVVIPDGVIEPENLTLELLDRNLSDGTETILQQITDLQSPSIRSNVSYSETYLMSRDQCYAFLCIDSLNPRSSQWIINQRFPTSNDMRQIWVTADNIISDTTADSSDENFQRYWIYGDTVYSLPEPRHCDEVGSLFMRMMGQFAKPTQYRILADY